VVQRVRAVVIGAVVMVRTVPQALS
jgi:hypothetical protein